MAAFRIVSAARKFQFTFASSPRQVKRMATSSTTNDQTWDEETLLKQVTDLVIQQRLLAGRSTQQDKVIRFVHPHQLQKLVDLNIDGKPNTQTEVMKLCKQAVEFSVRTNHPIFLNQLYHGADPVGLAATWLSEALNTNQHTFEVAPFFQLVERAVLSHLRRFIGWEDGDGIFSPGGSMSNMYGMVLARYNHCPEVKTRGMSSAGQLVAFTSDECHYSISKAANWMGLGTDNVIKVASDDQGRMIPSALESEIEKCLQSGRIPFVVNATCGTTVMGAYDPLNELADICTKYELWLHVDACWGGGALVSKKHRHLLNGIARADSVAWNPHKMLGAPLQCAAFLTRKKDLLHKCNSASASYLFQPDKFYDISYDTGDKSFQCGRKVDAFKLWLMWKARGDEGMEKLVDNAFDCATYLAERVSQHPNFRPVVSEPSCTNVCFWYVPPRLLNQPESAEWWRQLSTIAPIIKKRMVESGTMMIGYLPQASKNRVNFFRVVIACQPPATHQDMDFIVEEMNRLGRDL